MRARRRAARALSTTLFSVSAVLGLAACTTTGPAAIPQPLTPVHGEDARVASWIEATERAALARSGLRLHGKLSLETPDESGTVRQVILAERPGRLRLESLNVLGQTQTLLVIDGPDYSFYDGSSVEHGQVTPELLRSRLGLDLGPLEAIGLLLAEPPLPRGAPVRVYARAEQRVAVFSDHRLYFEPNGELLGADTLDADGQVRWSAHYSGWREVKGGRYPFAIVFRFPLTQLEAELQLEDVEVNPPLDPRLFRIPAGRHE